MYLDNSATTAVSDKAAQKIMELLTEKYGNPSSLHSKGFEAQKEQENARKIIANTLGVNDSEIYFTSGGTEANNLAVLGLVQRHIRTGGRIITSSVEHSSVIEACKQAQAMGFEVIYLPVNKSGAVLVSDLENYIDEKTVLVSLMYVNNETGTIQPVEKVKKIIKRKNSPAVFHCDAVQAYGKIPVKQNKISADLITITAHKIHGPKGAGALYINKGIKVLPRQFGGEQEKKIRPGTQSTPAICGFGAAADEIDFTALEKVFKLNTYLRECLKEMDGIVVNSPDDALSYIINFSVLGIRSETMLHYLASKNIYVSSGSACAKGKKSHVLEAMALDRKNIDSAIRVSFSKYNTKNDIDLLVSAVKEGINSLAKS